MLLSEIDPDTIHGTVKALGPTFYTKDVSFHPRMRAAHPALQADRNYHTIVGNYLAHNRQTLRIERVPGSHHWHKGLLWQRREE